MRLVFRLFGFALLVLALAAAGIVADLAFNRHRLINHLLGSEALAEACRPVLLQRLQGAGFQPDAVEFGDAADIALSMASGRTLTVPFTFEDGASQQRIDGLMACHVQGEDVTVAVRTRSTPVRAT